MEHRVSNCRSSRPLRRLAYAEGWLVVIQDQMHLDLWYFVKA